MAPPEASTYTCRRCEKRLTADAFGKTRNGHRQNSCLECMARFLQKKCEKCQKTKPRSDFGQTRLGKKRARCKDCFSGRLEQTTALCVRCKKQVDKANFTRTPSGARSYACKDCIRLPAKEKLCGGCNRMLPTEEFPRRPLKDTNHFFRGKRCHACTLQRARTRSDVEAIAPRPCLHCNKRYRLKMHQYRREMRKFCSIECQKAANRRPQVICTLCRKSRPYEAFDPKVRGPGIRSYCRDCGEEKAKGTFVRPDRATSPLAMLHYLRRLAQEKNQPCPIRPSYIASLVNKPCDLCAKEMRGVIAKDPDAPYDKENLVPVCNECRRLINARSYFEWIEWARVVTEGRSDKGAVVTQLSTAPTRKIQRERAKTMPKIEWLHPTTQQAQPLHETFEQKLARYSQLATDRREALADRKVAQTAQSRESRAKRRNAASGERPENLEDLRD